jgi:hypothetical protein
MKNDLSIYLSNLDTYPDGDQINDASNFAQDKATDYIHSIDNGAVVTVEDGDVFVQWSDSEIDSDGEWQSIAQSVFDESFGEMIDELQSKAQINNNL